jgi:hypothetical protein
MTASISKNFLRELDKKLWTAADRLRSKLDAAVYKHTVLDQFALAEEKSGGQWSGVTKTSPQGSPKGWRGCAKQFFTPKSIIGLVFEMIAPNQGRVCDTAMGSGGFFVTSERFIEEHAGKLGNPSVYGQDQWAGGHPFETCAARPQGEAAAEAAESKQSHHLVPNGSMSSNSSGEGDIISQVVNPKFGLDTSAFLN